MTRQIYTHNINVISVIGSWESIFSHVTQNTGLGLCLEDKMSILRDKVHLTLGNAIRLTSWLENLKLSLPHSMQSPEVSHSSSFSHIGIWQENDIYNATLFLGVQDTDLVSIFSKSWSRQHYRGRTLTSSMYSSSTPRLWACFSTDEACTISSVCDWVSLWRAKLLIFLKRVSVRIMWDSSPWKYSWKDSIKQIKMKWISFLNWS